MEELRVARENRPRRLPSGQFKLRASCGNDVTDGEQFRLIPESRYAEYLEEEAAADFDTDDSDPKGVEMDYGMVVSHERDSVFTVETIDGIVYLCCGGHYLFCPDDGECLIKMGPELPSKDERLHLEQCGRLIKFSRWNRHGYAYLFGELDIPDAVMLPGLGYPELDEATLKVVLVKV
ncbi:hypothetical protein EC988_005068 [Linderina pennispora]|nr:hypothetical protein EC988_005068 [Linderina pennispora]